MSCFCWHSSQKCGTCRQVIVFGKIQQFELDNLLNFRVKFFTGPKHIAQVWKQLRNPEFKGAQLYIEDSMNYQNYKDWPEKPIISAKEYVNMENLVIFYPKNSFLTPSFNRQLDNLNAGGLINHWAIEGQHKDFFIKRLDEKMPSSLNLSQIRGAFYLFVGCLGLSVALFAFELISKNCIFLRRAFETFL